MEKKCKVFENDDKVKKIVVMCPPCIYCTTDCDILNGLYLFSPNHISLSPAVVMSYYQLNQAASSCWCAPGVKGTGLGPIPQRVYELIFQTL